MCYTMSKFEVDMALLEKLCNAFGPSGHEHEAQKVARDHGKKFADEVLYDRMGSVVFRKGDKGPKIMLAGHVDEIGFVITNIEKNGFLRFHQLGGWWDQTLLTQEVLIKPSEGDKKIIGIIGAPPPHVLSPEARSKVVTKEKMFIDIGAGSKKEVEELGIRVGDPAVPYAEFRTMKRTRTEKKNEDNKDAEEITRERGASLESHFTDFIECVKTRKKPRSHEVLGYYCMTALHMGVRSYLEDRVFEFDAEDERVSKA